MSPGDPAFPVHPEQNYEDMHGLSKREYIAAIVMQGLVQDPNCTTMQRAAEGAVEGADALIAALNKVKP